VFPRRRPATAAEIARLIASFDTIASPVGLAEAEISEIATLDDLGAQFTVLEIPDPPPGGDRFYTVAQLEKSWAAGGGSDHDRDSYPRGLARVADPAYAPKLLFEPTRLTSSGWWMIDGIHRAAALLTMRTAAGATALRLSVFVLPRQLR
jgi:hypothetical protein